MKEGETILLTHHRESETFLKEKGRWEEEYREVKGTPEGEKGDGGVRPTKHLKKKKYHELR